MPLPVFDFFGCELCGIGAGVEKVPHLVLHRGQSDPELDIYWQQICAHKAMELMIDAEACKISAILHSDSCVAREICIGKLM